MEQTREEATDPVIADRAAGSSGFHLQGEIARGGMGAVMRAVDSRIRREIAVKYLLDQDNPAKKLRFIEEAQITGQLEHPNIVPIHELGTDSDGRLMFTMKMVKGRTLAQMLAREEGQGTLDKDDAAHAGSIAPGGSSLNRLLTILINVGNALAYAHARGVRSAVQDIGPLKDMPLTSFSANSSPVKDLTPLAGMKLTFLSLRNANEVRDLTPIKGMPLARLDLGWSPKMQGLAPLAGMKPTVLALPPSTTQQELSLVTKMPLTVLDIGSCSQLHDFTPILGLKLTYLSLPATTSDKDLIPLKRLPLTGLDLGVCHEVRDLTPVRGMKLTFLAFWGSSVTDLSPLEGMQLHHIRIPPPRPTTKGLDVLRRMKTLQTIGIRWDGAMIWPAAEFWRKVEAGHFK